MKKNLFSGKIKINKLFLQDLKKKQYLKEFKCCRIAEPLKVSNEDSYMIDFKQYSLNLTLKK